MTLSSSPNLISVVASEGYDISKNRIRMHQFDNAQHASVPQHGRHLGLIAGLWVQDDMPLKGFHREADLLKHT